MCLGFLFCSIGSHAESGQVRSARWPKLLVQIVKHRSDSVNDQCSLGRTDNVLVGVGDAAVVAQGICEFWN